MGECCIKGYRWDAQPKGLETQLAGRGCYITGSKLDAAVLVIHDLFGWKFPNIRVLADHYAEEVGATVYVPDFFGGESLPVEKLMQDPSTWGDLNLDIPGFVAKNTKEIRTPELFEVAEILRSRHKRTGAVGFCYGGWAVFTLGAKGKNVVDCISTAHPTFLTKEEIQNVNVPVQIMAPEFDPEFTSDLKAFSNQTIPSKGLPYDYQYFPGLEHAFATRGDPKKPKEREGTARAKNAAVYWLRQWLLDD